MKTTPVAAMLGLALAGSSPASAVDPPREWFEPATGHRVVRLSDAPESASLYFHQNAYTAAGDKLLISTPEGLATVDLATHRIETVVTGRVSQVVVGPRTRQVFYAKDGTVYATHLDTHATRAIVARPDLQTGSGLTVNADETLLAGSYVESGPVPAPEPAPSSNPLAAPPPQEARLEARWAQRLPMALYTIDVRTGEVKTIHHGGGDWLNHVQFSPTDPGQLMFCHEGPWHKVDRIWTIRTDGTGRRLMHARRIDMEIAGHEFWSHDGRTVWYDLQTPKSQEFWLAGVSLTGESAARYRLAREHWSVHFNISPDGRLFAGDGGGPRSVAAPGNGQWIYLFTPTPAGLEAERLVDLSKHDYQLEPNVTFTPDGKWIVFRSNMHGASHVYAVEVAHGPRPEHARLPALVLVGDSTVRNGRGDGEGGQWGWGEPLAAFFDPARIGVVNRALGGRSSRTYLTGGQWEAVRDELRPGDFVLMQFGHNDASPVNDTSRARGTRTGTGDDTEEIDNLLTHQHEVVHSYGWYLRRFVNEARAAGAHPIVLSPVPRKIWRDGRIERWTGYGAWAAEVARTERVPFLDLGEIVARRYDALGPPAVERLFADEHTHTTLAGAELSAESVVAGLKALPGDPLREVFSSRASEVAAAAP